jgi:hypothetical protein
LFSGDVKYLLELIKDLYLYQENEEDAKLPEYFINEMYKLVSENDRKKLVLVVNFYFTSKPFNFEDEDWYYDTVGYDPAASKILIEKANLRIRTNGISVLRKATNKSLKL